MDIKGFTRFKVNGLNIEKLLNKLNKLSVPLYNVVRRQYKKLRFTVNYSDTKKVIACLDNLCYNYTKAEETGFLPFFKQFYKRAGLIVGVIIFALCVLASSFFVYDIKVYGCENIDPQNLLQSISETGAVKKSFNKVDCRQIEKAIYAKYSNIAFVSASYKGLVLQINIVETENTPEVIDNAPRDLISSFKGKINRLIVYQGTPLVKAGDSVEIGQTLIGGYYIIPDDETQIPLRAMGEAYGIIELNYRETFESVKTVQSRNGKVQEFQYIELFGMNFPQKTYNIAYNSYETETEWSYIFKNNFLPARLVTVKYFETENVKLTQDFEKAKKVIIEEAEKNAAADAIGQGKIIEITTTIKDEGNIKYIDTKVLVEKSFF